VFSNLERFADLGESFEDASTSATPRPPDSTTPIDFIPSSFTTGPGPAAVSGLSLVVEAIGGEGSLCCTARCSSASSVISTSLLRRRELLDDDVEPVAVCNEQADDNEVSFSSLGTVIGNTVSCGENRSVMAWKWTVTRAFGFED
jgi:hypothetical protein